MSPPTPASQVAALAALARVKPDPRMDADILYAGLIAGAKERGATWAQIGSALLGVPDGKAGRRLAHQIARQANLKLLRAGKSGLEVPR